MNWRGTAISQMAASRCPATASIPPQPSGVPPDFDRFPLTVGPGETAPPLWAPEARYIARLLRGFAGLATRSRSPLKRSKSGATLTRCRSQSSRRSYAALLGRTAVPTVAGNTRPRRSPCTTSGWRSHGAQIAPSEGAFPCRRESARCIISAPLRGASISYLAFRSIASPLAHPARLGNRAGASNAAIAVVAKVCDARMLMSQKD